MVKDFLSNDEWLFYAHSDLESAELILRESDNFHIVVFHAHQAVEKILKRFLIINNQQFPFNHDLLRLLEIISQLKPCDSYIEDLSFLMLVYSGARYPKGDRISEDEALRSIIIAKKIIEAFTNRE